MSFVQKFIATVLPPRWVASLETASRDWKLQCPCGHERSVWEAGGIRWKAAGTPKVLLPCPACGQKTWQTCVHKPGTADVAPGG